MSDSKTTEAERRTQSKFSFLAPLLLILLPVSVIAAAEYGLSAVRPLAIAGAVRVEFHPVAVPADMALPLKPVGAWQLGSGDRRLAGISALAADRDHLVALTDFGIVVRLPRPGEGGQAEVRPLPDGPGDPHDKRNRDSEALARDVQGRGWWVAFERRDELWLYDRDFSRALSRVRIRRSGWGANAGIEAMMASLRGLLIIPEEAAALFQLDKGRAAGRLPLTGGHARVSDATLLTNGRIIAVERRFGWRGFSNALLLLQREGRGYKVVRRAALKLSPLDNVEAIAVEPRPAGEARLWLATDDNGQRPLRTLLLALDAPREWLDGP